VWAAFWGGNKGIGANVVACFDLDGNRVWSRFCGQTDISEHGTHSSPALCGDYLIFKSGAALLGFEKASGKLAWRKEIEGGIGASPLPLRVGKEILAYVPQIGLIRPSDGALLCKAAVTTDIPTPAINDGVIYGVGEKQFFSLKLPRDDSGPLALKTLLKTPWKNVAYHMPGVFTDSIIASPLYDRGLVYVVSQGGAISTPRAANASMPMRWIRCTLASRGFSWWASAPARALAASISSSATTRGRRWSSSRARDIKNWRRTCWLSTIVRGHSPSRRATSSSKAGGSTSAAADSCTASGSKGMKDESDLEMAVGDARGGRIRGAEPRCR
jgi:hypothetical protein